MLCQVLAAATGRGEVVAVVDTCDQFDPRSAADAGVDLTRLLWIRERGDAPRALKAVNLIVQAGGFGIGRLYSAGGARTSGVMTGVLRAMKAVGRA